MAKNRRLARGNQFSATVPVGTTSGAPVVIGQIPAVAMNDRGSNGNAATKATVQTDGTWLMSVKGENNAGNVAVAEGDILYYEAGQTPPLNKDNVAGVRWGYALGAVTSGATATIEVKCGY